MQTPLAEITLEALTAALASPEPTPGGGSVSAAAVAMAAGLAGMVAGLSIGRTADVPEEDWRAAIDEAAGLRVKALALVDEDARAFDAVMAALRLPKETGEEKALRRETLARANLAASLVPLETAVAGLAVLRLAFLAAQGNPRAISDAGVAGELALAGIAGAALNVRINLPSLGEEQRKDLSSRLAPVEQEGRELAAKIRSMVEAKIS